jgi:hypothetical protein
MPIVRYHEKTPNVHKRWSTQNVINVKQLVRIQGGILGSLRNGT